jgi:hypothetical protein
VTTWFSTINTSDPAKSVLKGNGAVFCAAIAVLLAMAFFLVECSRHPALLDDTAITFVGP